MTKRAKTKKAASRPGKNKPARAKTASAKSTSKAAASKATARPKPKAKAAKKSAAKAKPKSAKAGPAKKSVTKSTASKRSAATKAKTKTKVKAATKAKSKPAVKAKSAAVKKSKAAPKLKATTKAAASKRTSKTKPVSKKSAAKTPRNATPATTKTSKAPNARAKSAKPARSAAPLNAVKPAKSVKSGSASTTAGLATAPSGPTTSAKPSPSAKTRAHAPTAKLHGYAQQDPRLSTTAFLTGATSAEPATAELAARAIQLVPPTRSLATKPRMRVPIERARAFWLDRQGLAKPALMPAATDVLHDLVARSGWIRTLGGIDAYLGVRARIPTMRRSDVDDALMTRKIVVSPAVRGCIYAVPHIDAALALRVAEAQSRVRHEREMARLGVSHAELDDVGDAVAIVLKQGPQTPDTLRRALPEGVVRGLGDAGKKLGVTSTLPPALRRLEFAGRVERASESGRIDTERYVWQRPTRAAIGAPGDPGDGPGLWGRLASRFFSFAGPAARSDFANWSGLSQRAALYAIEDAGLVHVAVDGYSEEAFIHEADLDALAAAAAPARFSLVAFEDNFIALHGTLGVLADPAHHNLPVQQWGKPGIALLGIAKHAHCRGIIDGGRLCGWWEFDPVRSQVVWATFDSLTAKRRNELDRETQALGTFIAEEIGHGRISSIDTDAALRERCAKVKAMQK